MNIPTNAHIKWIDGLKGILALIVVLAHLRGAFSSVIDENLLLYTFPLAELSNGTMAVAAFICLSSIVMTFKCRDASAWQGILLKRYFRLALPICPIVLLYVLMWKEDLLFNNSLATIIDSPILNSTAPTSFKIVLKVILTTPFGYGDGYMFVFWMLGYIFITPFVVVLLDIITENMSAKKVIIFTLFCTLISLIVNPWFINIFAGFLFAKFICEASNMRMNMRWLVLILLIALYIAIHFTATYVRENMPNTTVFTHSVATFKGIILVSIFMLSKQLQEIFSRRPVVWLGKISFEIYLLHLIVIFSFGCWMYLRIPYFNHRMILIYVGVLLVSILLAWFWHGMVNKPIDRFLSKCLRRFT